MVIAVDNTGNYVGELY